MSSVEIAPIVKTIEVTCTAPEAFRLFTEEMGRWWPLETHTRAATTEGEKPVGVTVEPRVGGRVFETLQNGAELDWGQVITYQPGELFAMSWQLDRPSSQATAVRVSFQPLDEVSCRVTLTHEGWERLGDEAGRLHDAYTSGWSGVFEQCFGEFAGRR